MSKLKHPKRDQVIAVMQRAHQLDQEKKGPDAAAAYLEALALAERWGLAGAYLLWHVATSHDRIGEHEMAFKHIVRGLELDPLAAPLRQTFDEVCEHLRAALAYPNRDASDPSTPRYYDLLVRAGEADVRSHEAMARWCAATGDHARARVLADALTMLNPLDASAWRCAAEVARLAGDESRASECLAEVGVLEAEASPFPAKEVARG